MHIYINIILLLVLVRRPVPNQGCNMSYIILFFNVRRLVFAEKKQKMLNYTLFDLR